MDREGSRRGRTPGGRRRAALAVPLLSGILLAFAAGAASAEEELFLDPFRSINQPAHELNVNFDHRLLRPTTLFYRETVPAPIRTGLHNLLSNWLLPSDFINHLLQADVESAGRTALRFGFNTVFGVGSIHDLAAPEGLPRIETDFGLTLARYGIGEGAYLSVPLIGPTTLRDLPGFALGTYASPARLGDFDTLGTASYAAFNVVDARDRNFTLIDQVFHEAEDSYISTRNAFLQNRRLRISGGATDPDDLPGLYDN